MMTELKEGHPLDLFLDQLYKNIPDDATRKMRIKAWEHLQALGLPTSKNEVFRYVPLRKFFSRAYVPSQPKHVQPEAIAPHIFPECRNSVIVFVNGFYSQELSSVSALPKRVVITSLDEAAKTYGALLNNHWTKSLKEETDPFALMNACLHDRGAFIYLPPKTILEAPLQILHIIDTDNQPLLIQPRLNLFAGAQSEIKCISSQARLSGAWNAMNGVVECIIEEDSHVHFTQALVEDPEGNWCFEAVRSSLKRNSTFNLVSLTEGSETVRKDYRVTLMGENSEANLNGLSMLDGKSESHTHVLIDHQAPQCRSRQLFKGVLNGTSRSSFEGKILVRQAAQKTDAFQLNNNLLISDRAAADSKPNLEIFADDVKASHGATFGQLDPEQLFMLKSRGIHETQAKNLLVYGFCREVIDMISLPSLLERSIQYLYRYGKG